MKIIFAILILCFCGLNSTAQRSTLPQPYSITISASSEVKAGVPANIRVRIVNSSDQDLDLSGSVSDLTGLDPTVPVAQRPRDDSPALQRRVK